MPAGSAAASLLRLCPPQGARRAYGHPMATLWSPNGHPMATLWPPSGRPMVTLRAPYGCAQAMGAIALRPQRS